MNDSRFTSAVSPLSWVELGVLQACREVTLQAKELIPILALALGVPQGDLLYTWKRRCKQHGDLTKTDWGYFFHGFECDLKNKKDGRFLRVDFGLRSQLDTLTGWRTLQFIMASSAPWPEFSELKFYFMNNGPPFNEYSGTATKMFEIWDAMRLKGVFEYTAPALVAFREQHTTIGPDGIRLVRFPPGTPDEMFLDCFVADRECLSPYGFELLAAFSTSNGAILNDSHVSK